MIKLAEEFKRLVKMKAILKEIEFDASFNYTLEESQYLKDRDKFIEVLTELDDLSECQDIVIRSYPYA